MAHILLAGSDADAVARAYAQLAAAGYVVDITWTLEQTQDNLRYGTYDAVVTEWAKELRCGLPIVLLHRGKDFINAVIEALSGI